MLIHQALPLALLAATASALPSAPLLKRAEELPPGVNHSLSVEVGSSGSLTQCSPVNITWSAAVQPEGEAGGPGGPYMLTLDARRIDLKARLYYEQRTFEPDAPRVWEWPVDVPVDTQVSITVSSFENGNASSNDGDIWYGGTEVLTVLPSSNDTCIPEVNRPISFDESQLTSIRSCEPTELTWSGSAPPYEVFLYTQNTIGGTGSGSDRFSLGTTNETSLTWDVDFPAGLAYYLEIRASRRRSYSMNAALRIEGQTGNCTIPEIHQLVEPVSAASLSSVASSLWVIVPSALLWMTVA